MSDDTTDGATLSTRKCLSMRLASGAAVAGYPLDGGGFEWAFTAREGIVTRIRLSRDATYAIGLIADNLLDPTGEDAA